MKSTMVYGHVGMLNETSCIIFDDFSILFWLMYGRYGRYGVPLEIIEVLLKDFGKHYLDGEIWYVCEHYILCSDLITSHRFGRGNFTEAQKVLSPDGTSLAWEFFR